MAIAYNTSAVRDGLVFYYDMSNTGKSFRGAPTTNLMRLVNDVSGTQYAPDDQWTSPVSVLTKSFNSSISTPVGFGATLISESGTAGSHHLSRWGGSEISGDHALSCYVYPLASNINNFSIGMLGATQPAVFNLNTKTVTSAGGTGIVTNSVFINDVPDYPGWLRLAATINGRAGGWVGSMGLDVNTSYTGTAGGRSFYIAGIQYERRALSTPFTTGSRSNTQALFDLTNINTITANNLTYAIDSTFSFNGTSNLLNPSISHSYLSSSALEVVFRSTSHGTGFKTIFGYRHNDGYSFPTIGSLYLNANTLSATLIASSQGYRTATVASAIATNTFYHVVLNKNTINGSLEIYVNGVLSGSQTFDVATYGQWPSAGSFIGANILDIGKSTNTNAGQGWSADHFSGSIPVAKVYNRILSPTEIQRNFNALRGRYGI